MIPDKLESNLAQVRRVRQLLRGLLAEAGDRVSGPDSRAGALSQAAFRSIVLAARLSRIAATLRLSGQLEVATMNCCAPARCW